MKRQLETLETRFCLSAELAPSEGPVHSGGNFVRHEHAEFRFMSFGGDGGVKFEQTSVVFAKGDKIVAAKRFGTKLAMAGGHDDFTAGGGFDRNRADHAGAWADPGVHGGYIPAAPPPIAGFHPAGGFIGGIIISFDGDGAVDSGGATTNASTGSTSPEVAQSVKSAVSA